MAMATLEQLREAVAAADRLRQAADVDYIRAAQRIKGFEPANGGAALKRIKPDTSPAAVKARDDRKLALARATKKLRGAERALDESILRAARPNGTTRVEPVYTPDSGHRFLRDVTVAWSDPAARERLERHQRIELERRESGTVQGQGFLAPSFWSDRWADQPRAAAVVRSSIPAYPLPERGGIGYLPAFSEGAVVSLLGSTSGVNQAVADADAGGVSSGYVEAELVTLAANWDIDRAVFERARPAGEIAFGRDLINAYDAALDDNLVNGDGSTGNHVGLLNVVGGGSYDGSGAADAPAQLQALAAAAAAMFGARHALPTHLALNPKRYLFLTAGVTTAGAPLLAQGGTPTVGLGTDPTWSAGTILGMRVLVTDRLGESGAVLWRPADAVFAGTEVLFQMPQLQSSHLAIRLQAYGVSQSFIHRIPSSVTLVTALPATGF